MGILDPRSTVAGKSGIITLAKTDVGLANVDNTADTDKPLSAAMQTAMDGKLGAADISPITGLSVRVQNLNVVAGAGQATATWDAPTVTTGIAGYETRYRTITSTTVGPWTSFSFRPATVFTETVTGLTNSQAYQVDVLAVYAQTVTPSTPALYADQFSGTSTWSAANPRVASDGSTTRPWVIFTASATTWSSSLYDGAVRGAVGNAPVAHLMDVGAPSVTKRIRVGIKALLSDTSKRDVGILFRSSNNDATNNWLVHANTGVWVVRKMVGGATTTIATSTVTAAVGDIIEVVPGTASDAISVKVNNVVIWSGVDSDLAANQYAGFRLQAQANGQTYSKDQTSAVDFVSVFAS